MMNKLELITETTYYYANGQTRTVDFRDTMLLDGVGHRTYTYLGQIGEEYACRMACHYNPDDALEVMMGWYEHPRNDLIGTQVTCAG